MQDPSVTCAMLTFGRYRADLDGRQLLNEAVESFLRQTYANKRLLILNDTPGQSVFFSRPEVTVINYYQRISHLGVKRNIAAANASSDYLLVWDDDDISLSNRIEATVEHFERTGCDYTAPRNFWFSQGNKKYDYKVAGNWGAMCGASYRMESFRKVKYREMNSGEDQTLVSDMEQAGFKVEGMLSDPADTCLIYRWGFLARHVSGYGSNDGYSILGNGEFVPGTIAIQPGWQHDYEQIVRDLAAKVSR